MLGNWVLSVLSWVRVSQEEVKLIRVKVPSWLEAVPSALCPPTPHGRYEKLDASFTGWTENGTTVSPLTMSVESYWS